MNDKNRIIKKKVVQIPAVTGSGPEIWDGKNEGWTLVTYKRKKKNKKV
jgi:hypothetical protein